MSSGFVSGGTVDAPVERDDEWLKAQQEIEANRRRKEEEGSQGGKSLYEILQNNKAAKQEAFEESTRLKNQFRNLDEDEVEFLDSVLESTRKREAEVKRETAEQLEQFRKQQEKADQALLENSQDTQQTQAPLSEKDSGQDVKWTVNKKRRRERGGEKEESKGLKIRRTSSTLDDHGDLATKKGPILKNSTKPKDTQESSPILPSPSHSPTPEAQKEIEQGGAKGAKPPSNLGLVSYSSEEDD